MSIMKFTASADTTITDAFKPYTTNRAYYANMGAADSLEIFSIAHSGSVPEKSRALIRFPVNEISSSRNSGLIPSKGNVNFILKLFNVEHPETLPKNYDIVIKPISGSWDEGYGLDLENYTDIGQNQNGGYGVGWKYKSTAGSEVWAVEGGDYYSGYDKVFHLDAGTEDVELDITDIVEDQIDGTISSDGFGVMLSGSFEDGSNNTTYYTKRFSARSSEYFYKKPQIEARWETLTKDDRGSLFYEAPNLEASDNLQNIYFYNRVNGTLKDIPGGVVPFVKLLDEDDNSLIDNILSDKISTGTYRARVSITGSEDAELSDVWYSGSNTYFTGFISAKVREFEDSLTDNEYTIAITNLKNIYKQNEKPIIKIFSRQKNWSPSVYKIANNTLNSLKFDNLYYKIFRIVDKLTIVDYGISPIAYTKCSYDKNGNYFDLDMSSLEAGYAYGIKLMILKDDVKVELPNTYRFKVE